MYSISPTALLLDSPVTLRVYQPTAVSPGAGETTDTSGNLLLGHSCPSSRVVSWSKPGHPGVGGEEGVSMHVLLETTLPDTPLLLWDQLH